MINNRQAGRRRGRGGNGNNNNGGGGNGPRSNGQRDNGNRIDNRARGNANQLYEKYKNLASDAQRQGDRVNTEYYLQFADHYFRVLSETRNRFEEQNQQRRQSNDGYEAQAFVGSFDTGFDNQDDEYGDEGEPIRSGEQAFGEDRNADRDGNRANGQNVAQNGQNQNAQGQNTQGQNGQGQNGQGQNGQGFRRDGRPQREDARPPRDGTRADANRRDDEGAERYQPTRDQAPREQAGREEPRARYDAPHDGARDPGRDGESDGAPRRAPRAARRDRDEGTAPVNRDAAQPAVQPTAASAEAEAAPEAEAPRRGRGRPRRERPAEEAPVGFDAALLPPSIGIASATPAAEAAESEEKPRRRRVRAAPTEVTPASGCGPAIGRFEPPNHRGTGERLPDLLRAVTLIR